MLGAILGLPEQVENAKRVSLRSDLAALPGRRYQSLLISGLGGSAIGGDLLHAGFQSQLNCPAVVVRDYHLPEYVNSETLVFATSNSGNTEETLACYAAARKARAAIVAFTTGGKLAELAQADGVPLVTFPGGLQPRAAVGYSFIPLIVCAARLGLMPELLVDEIDEAAAVLRAVRDDCNPDVPQTHNEAKQLASVWRGKIPVIYGSQAERGVVAYRWKTQINENAKAYAVWNVFPELNHNETVGWSGGRDQGDVEKSLSLVVLRDDREPAQIRRRVDLTKQIIARRAAEINEVWARGGGTLSRMLSLVYIGDFASYYLAMAYGEDPTPVRVIDWLKGQLAEAQP
ncbi:MAG: bifunctional phosphoglucose/phosphomannose isomerase [Candidatus Eremiobacteraeota bacterium]|nr:bifunctional phosphoglucose/phosphomannose isomerase [Candidatus Eremiobacteraeota bacterium]